MPHWLFVFENRRRHKIELSERLSQAHQNERNRSAFENDELNLNSRLDLDYESMIDYLVSKGLDENQIRQGSMPESSLNEIVSLFDDRFKPGALRGIHIGNFVGISIGYILSKCYERDNESFIVAIDPNVPHRGIERPNDICIELLTRMGIQNNVLCINGYSLEKSLSNDGKVYDGVYNPEKNFALELGAGNQLSYLLKLSADFYHFIVLDGNHNSEYLKRELELASELIVENGVIIVDDVDLNWPSIKKVFEECQIFGLSNVYTNGRIGILERVTMTS